MSVLSNCRLSYSVFSLIFVSYITCCQSFAFLQKTPTTKNANIYAIDAPEGFDTTSSFNGYLSIQNSAAIIMLQLENSNYIRIFKAIDQSYLDRNKLRLIEKGDLKTRSGDKGKFLTLSFDLNGDVFIRKMVFIGDTKNTLWLNITYPKDLEELLEQPIEQSIKTANLELLD
jgi:hypothetical protein|tara:strand:- start:18233 stop:18748 length:516 start_codon:yes stop_codon:yes gene_type:complete